MRPGATVIEWVGEVPVEANDLVSSVRTALNPRTWLQRVLCGGPRPTREVEAQAAALGLSPRTLDRVRQSLAVVALQRHLKGKKIWYLALPDRQELPPREYMEPLPGDLVRPPPDLGD